MRLLEEEEEKCGIIVKMVRLKEKIQTITH